MLELWCYDASVEYRLAADYWFLAVYFYEQIQYEAVFISNRLSQLNDAARYISSLGRLQRMDKYVYICLIVITLIFLQTFFT